MHIRIHCLDDVCIPLIASLKINMQQRVGAELLREIERVCKPLPIRFHFFFLVFSSCANVNISTVWGAVFGMQEHTTHACA